MALNISWKSHTINTVLYGNLPKVSSKMSKHRMQLTGHLIRHEEEVANKLDGPQEAERERPTSKIFLMTQEKKM